MSEAVKSKIYPSLETIQDESTLLQVMEEVTFYASKKDVADNLNPAQLVELDEAIKEADLNETISWTDFKNDLDEWRKK